MFKPFASLVLVVFCAACGSSFDASGAGGAAGASGTGDAAGDSSGGYTSGAGSSSAGLGGSGEAGGGAASGAGAGGTATGSGGSGGWAFGTGGGHFGGFGNYGGFGGSATAGGSGGSGGVDCATLKTEYAAAVQKARTCDKGSTDECSAGSTLSSVGCGCPVLVNANSPSKAVAEEKYKEIQANKCETGAICNIACLPDTSADCAAQSTSTDFVCSGSSVAAAN